MCTGTGGEDATAGEDASAEMKLPADLLASSSSCTGAHAEATDADFLMVMARRGDDEDNDKVAILSALMGIKLWICLHRRKISSFFLWKCSRTRISVVIFLMHVSVVGS